MLIQGIYNINNIFFYKVPKIVIGSRLFAPPTLYYGLCMYEFNIHIIHINKICVYSLFI